MFATEQCLLVLSHHPDTWIMAAQYLDQTAKHLTEKAVRIPTPMRVLTDETFLSSWFKFDKKFVRKICAINSSPLDELSGTLLSSFNQK